MRLTLELVQKSEQCINPARLRELSLRGYHIEALENLGVTKDLFECLDFSDNNILKITVFPPLRRVKSLIFANNAIQRIAPEAFNNLPNLESVVLTKNKLRSLVDLEPLAACKKLERLTLRENDICAHEHYRAYVVYILRKTNLRILDFQKVGDKEREAAVRLFETDNPNLIDEIAPVRRSREEEAAERRKRLSPEQQQQYAKLIESATDAAHIQLLQEKFDRGEEPPENLDELTSGATFSVEMVS